MNRFPTNEVLFKSTHGAESITVRGIQLQCDAEGFVQGPADLETEIAPHGFVRAEAWLDKQSEEDKLRIAALYPPLVARLNAAEKAKLARKSVKAAPATA